LSIKGVNRSDDPENRANRGQTSDDFFADSTIGFAAFELQSFIDLVMRESSKIRVAIDD
jgi:hypothetical protein